MRSLRLLMFWSIFLLAGSGALSLATEDESAAVVEKPLSQLTDHEISRLGEKALSIRPGEWKHAESANFVYHYFHDFAMKPVASEAEFYYRVIASELEKDTTRQAVTNPAALENKLGSNLARVARAIKIPPTSNN